MKTSKSDIEPIRADGDDAQEKQKASVKSRRKSSNKTSPKALSKEDLSQKEKLESVRKANKALLKALELMSQRHGSTIDAKGDI